jgi:translation initiation factor IF-3
MDRNKAPVARDTGPPMNDDIAYNELRVVTPNPQGKDEPLGVMSRSEALQKAKDMGDLDLILINPNSDPPVCKIVDYSKFRYGQEKKAKELKKNSKTVEVKEIKMSYKIDVHDYDVRRKSAMKFLKQGNRVKCTVMFRGREIQHDALGFELLEKLAVDLDDTCVKEGRPKREGKNLSIILGPRPEVLKAINDSKRREIADKKKEKAVTLKQRVAGEELQGALAKEIAAASRKLEEEESDEDDDESDDDDDDESLDSLLGADDLTSTLFG